MFSPHRRPGPAGFTLIELIAAMTILLLLTAVALPVARVQVQREREIELRRDLCEIRQPVPLKPLDGGGLAFRSPRPSSLVSSSHSNTSN